MYDIFWVNLSKKKRNKNNIVQKTGTVLIVELPKTWVSLKAKEYSQSVLDPLRRGLLKSYSTKLHQKHWTEKITYDAQWAYSKPQRH